MFEVEQKFILDVEQEKRLLEGADFLGEKTFTDTYYDTRDCTLTKNDIWLRKRGEVFELKIPMHQIEDVVTRQYQEIEGEEKIREVFAIAPKQDFVSDIAEYGHVPFCECVTARRKYKRGKFVIDLDKVSYGCEEAEGFVYCIGEIELMVGEKGEMDKATLEIGRFAQENGLEVRTVRGKVIEYLKRKKPEHYQTLVAAGVVHEKD